MTTADRKRFLRLAEGLTAGVISTSRAADMLRSWALPPKGPKKSLPGKSIRQAKAEKKAAHREETARIREAVMGRADGVCEVCLFPAYDGNPLVMHHKEGGNGRRRQKQSVENCAAIHMTCHRLIHSGKAA